MSDGSSAQDVLNWVCSNQDAILPALAVVVVPVASVLSGFNDKLPWWVGHLLNLLGINWGTLARKGFTMLDAALAQRYTSRAISSGALVPAPVPSPPGTTAQDLNRQELTSLGAQK